MVRFLSAFIISFTVIPITWADNAVVSQTQQIDTQMSRFNGRVKGYEDNPTTLGVVKLPANSPFDPSLTVRERDQIAARVAKILAGENRLPANRKDKGQK